MGHWVLRPGALDILYDVKDSVSTGLPVVWLLGILPRSLVASLQGGRAEPCFVLLGCFLVFGKGMSLALASWLGATKSFMKRAQSCTG